MVKRKRLAALLLAAGLSLSLVACGQNTDGNAVDGGESEAGSSENSLLSIGDTFTGENFALTLTNVAFADELYTFANEVNTVADDYFMLPLAEQQTNPGGLKIRAKEGSILLTFTFDYRFVGKSALSDNFSDLGAPFVYYGDGYTFDGNDTSAPTEYAIFAKPSTEDSWYILNHADGLDVQNSTKLYAVNSNYKPFDSTTYECRGYITLPMEVCENESEPLEIIFNLVSEYTERFSVR